VATGATPLSRPSPPHKTGWTGAGSIARAGRAIGEMGTGATSTSRPRHGDGGHGRDGRQRVEARQRVELRQRSEVRQRVERSFGRGVDAQIRGQRRQAELSAAPARLDWLRRHCWPRRLAASHHALSVSRLITQEAIFARRPALLAEGEADRCRATPRPRRRGVRGSLV